MKQILLKSYAKINLFLNVGKKIKNRRLHNIQSLIFLLNLNDQIKINSINSSKDIVKFIGKFKNHIKKKKNSVSKSITLLRKKNLIKKNENYRITVKKNIPVFSGLGGGSSNASTIIKYFLKDKKITDNNISFFSKYLGSDVILFFKSKKIFQKKLNKTLNYRKNYNFYFLLVYPNLKCSSKVIYSKVNKFDKIRNKNYYANKSKLSLVKALKFEKNSLEKIVTSKFPVIGKILTEIEMLKNCQFSRLTGSGSTCFGLFLSKKDGVSALRRIKKKFPNFWCVLCKSI